LSIKNSLSEDVNDHVPHRPYRHHAGFRINALAFRFQGSSFRFQDSGFRVQDFAIVVEGPRSMRGFKRVQGSRFKVYDLVQGQGARGSWVGFGGGGHEQPLRRRIKQFEESSY